jgi:cysteinyl-tRNA synthetase
LDEHTACILDFENSQAEIKGIGRITLRTSDRELFFKPGDRLPLDVLRGGDADFGWHPDPAETRTSQNDSVRTPDSFWDKIHALEASFQKGLEKHDPRASTNALLELDRTIWQAQRDLESEEFIAQARDTLRDLIVLTGNELASSPGNQSDCLAPLVEALLELRRKFRANKQWAEADAIRDIFQLVNITVEDAKNGSQWRWGL